MRGEEYMYAMHALCSLHFSRINIYLVIQH